MIQRDEQQRRQQIKSIRMVPETREYEYASDRVGYLNRFKFSDGLECVAHYYDGGITCNWEKFNEED